MKKQDTLTLTGVVVGFLMMIWAMAIGKSMIHLDFAQLKIFFDPSSIIITIGGSLCAMLVNYPIAQFKKLFKILLQSFKETEKSNIDVINSFIDLSRKARREGLLSLEDEVNEINDAYLKKGLQMVVDGVEADTIKEIMELEIDETERRHKEGVDMLKAWGAYAPAFGMVGTLIGLIQMLANLSDSSQIASGMSKALITTYYGALMAYLVFNPMAANLALKAELESATMEMMLEGILAIQAGVNPRIVEEKLIAYLSTEDRLKFKTTQVDEEGVTQNV